MRIYKAALCVMLAAVFVTNVDAKKKPVYKDASRPVEERVEDLLSRMTLEEKKGDITCLVKHLQERLMESMDLLYVWKLM